jgi:hypothetical protein
MRAQRFTNHSNSLNKRRPVELAGVVLALALLSGLLTACEASPTTTPLTTPVTTPTDAGGPTTTTEVPPTTTTTTVRPTNTTVPPTTTTTVAPTTTTTIPPTTTTTTVPPISGFVHPGVLVSQSDLNFVKARIAANQEPWASAFTRMQNSGMSSPTILRPTAYRFSSLSYPPMPVAQVRCWTSSTQLYAEGLGLTQSGCREQTDDAMAAYTQALMWYFTGNIAYANKAIEIMNAWSATNTEILFDQPRATTNNAQVWGNGKLQAGWTAEIITRAAEIIRYSNAGWSSTDITRFSQMLNNVYLPLTITGWTSQSNWQMTFADATINIGIFNDDRATFNAGVAYWRTKVTSTIYMTSDGVQPVAPNTGSAYDTPAEINSYWYSPTTYINGLQQETGRDLSHMMMGLGSMSNAAASAGIQGVDLFAEQSTRIRAAYELNAGFTNEYLDEVAQLGTTPPSAWRPTGWVNPNFKTGGEAYKGGWEVAYEHYAVQLGIPMPNTEKLVNRLRPTGTAMQLSWETLTHAR